MPTSRGVQERALAEALKARPSKPEDAAIEALARRLAQVMDLERGEEGEAAVLVKLGAEYRQALAALGLTLQSRVQMAGRSGQTEQPVPRSPLDELRRRREQRSS